MTIDSIEAFPNKYDLILLDLMLPGGVTGFDIFDMLQERPAIRHIPVVAVSASDPDIAIPKAQAKGFAGYISKPINRGTFSKQLLAVLQGESIWE
jgi:CheY-like chemotaxis protein